MMIMRPIDPVEESKNLSMMLEFFSKNIDKLPITDQMAFVQANLEFNEKLKPIYVRGLIMLNGGEE